MSLIAVILGAVGAIVSVFKNRWCFVVWMVPNIYWTWYNWPAIQSWVFVIMSASCVAGWIEWGRGEDEIGRLLAENALFRQGWTKAQDRIIALQTRIDELTVAIK